MIRSVSSLVVLGALALFCAACPAKKKEASADPAAEKEKVNRGDDKEPDEAEEGEAKEEADKKERGGW